MTTNPFFHGVTKPTINRLLMIRPNGDAPVVYRQISKRQQSLADHEIVGSACHIYADYAEVIGARIAHASDDSDFSGEVVQVLYSVEGYCGTQIIHLGDYSTADQARQAIDKVASTCETPLCWEISIGHVCEDAAQWLMKKAGALPDDSLYVDMARMGDVFVIKIIAAPWDDKSLAADGTTAAELKQEQKAAGLPDSLVELLHLASQAKVRILILDQDAAILKGLPVYDW